jgi:ATP synthase protein I
LSEQDEKSTSKKNVWIQVGRMTQLAMVMPAATVAGWLLGTALDHWLHTGWISAVGLILGIVAGFIELLRTVTSTSSKE